MITVSALIHSELDDTTRHVGTPATELYQCRMCAYPSAAANAAHRNGRYS